jgi:quercetin dioxygenase-like cupin family protein
MSINAFMTNLVWMVSKKSGKFFKPKSRWIDPYKKEHPTDKLKIKLILNEKIKGDRIVGLKARIESGQAHQLHIHENEYVLVYSLRGKCQVTVGTKIKTVSPHTMIFIPPKVPHRFYNRFSSAWEGIAFAIGTRSKINNIWMEG